MHLALADLQPQYTSSGIFEDMMGMLRGHVAIILLTMEEERSLILLQSWCRIQSTGGSCAANSLVEFSLA